MGGVNTRAWDTPNRGQAMGIQHLEFVAGTIGVKVSYHEQREGKGNLIAGHFDRSSGLLCFVILIVGVDGEGDVTCI